MAALWRVWALMSSARHADLVTSDTSDTCDTSPACLNNGARLQLLFLMGPWIPGMGRCLSQVISHIQQKQRQALTRETTCDSAFSANE